MQLVSQAVALGLEGLAITDHDTCIGWPQAMLAAKERAIHVVPGIELSCQYGQSREVHLLAYWPDPEYPQLHQTLQQLQQARHQRNDRIIQKLRQAGYAVSPERVAQLARGESVGRPHIAMALVEAGWAYSIQDAFHKFLNQGGVGYVPRYKLDPLDCVRLITAAGGVAVFAHPATAGCDPLIPELKQAGLRGLEVYHPNHPLNQEIHYTALCRKYQLIATGGSDCHTGGLGSKTCSRQAVAALEKFRQ